MVKFEYKTITSDLSDKKNVNDDLLNRINELGEKGWEMVSMVSNTGLGSSRYSLVSITVYALCVFKRIKT